MSDAFPWARSCSYNPDAKRAFLNRARRQFNRFAKHAGLPRGAYQVRANQGGIAVSGEVYFEASGLYAWCEQSFDGSPIVIARTSPEIGARAAFHGHNHQVRADVLDYPGQFAAWLERHVGWTPNRKDEM